MKDIAETFLAVHWIRFHAPSAGGWIQFLLRELDPPWRKWRSHMPQQRYHGLQPRPTQLPSWALDCSYSLSLSLSHYWLWWKKASHKQSYEKAQGSRNWALCLKPCVWAILEADPPALSETTALTHSLIVTSWETLSQTTQPRCTGCLTKKLCVIITIFKLLSYRIVCYATI